jgi:sugar fermentation stimulation protein A
MGDLHTRFVKDKMIPKVSYTFPSDLVRATVVKRPSATIKSPYVADIRVDGIDEIMLCHSPGLGCCGLVEAGRVIYVLPSREGSKTAWTAHMAECSDSEGAHNVGIHPMIGQSVAATYLSNISADAVWKSEVVVAESTRIDYVGLLPNGKKIYVEVKTAMVSTECTVPRTSRCAVFPEGYRKSKNEPVSPRAIKHARVLAELKGRADTERCVLLYVVPRDDCGGGVIINPSDPWYLAAVRDAVAAGVETIGLAFRYDVAGIVSFKGTLPVIV